MPRRPGRAGRGGLPAAVEDVGAPAADQHVVARAAEQRVVAGAADQDVVAVAAVEREQSAPAARPEASTTSSPARALTVSRSLPASAPVMFTRGQAEHRDGARAAPGDDHDVVAVGGVDDDVVGREVVAAAGGREVGVDVDVTSVPDRSLTVTVSAPPSALTSIVSTSSRSITMLPRLRVKRTRSPLAEASKISSPLRCR